jgi:hypothetical protein
VDEVSFNKLSAVECSDAECRNGKLTVSSIDHQAMQSFLYYSRDPRAGGVMSSICHNSASGSAIKSMAIEKSLVEKGFVPITRRWSGKPSICVFELLPRSRRL